MMKPQQNLREKAPLLQAEAAHDAKIDSRQPALRVEEQVAGMHIGVKKTVAHGMTQKGLDDQAPEARKIERPARKGLDIGERAAVNPFQRQDFAGGAVPIDLGHTKIIIVLDVFGKFGGGRRLQPEIHFHLDRTSQRFDHFDRFQPRALRGNFWARRAAKNMSREIAGETPRDAGPQHLDRDVALAVGVLDAGAMHLRDRGGGDRLAEIDTKIIGQRPRESRLDHADGDVAREWLHAVLQGLKLARHLLSDHVWTSRQGLAKLDVGGAEPRHRRRKPVQTAVLGGRQPRQIKAEARRGRTDRSDQRRKKRPRAPE